jgi:3-hydroxyacyl-CoA dehydrogenase/enoyl-CoA hydratase/3-hydroxybutyryl-CoA epimerase
MIQAFFFDLAAINGGALRPKDVPKFTATKVGVLGAGMMGAGIAYSCARAGMEVVLKDVKQESADKGKAYSESILSKAVQRGKMDEAKKAEILDRITATTEANDFKGVDLVIEAVFEDPTLKAQVFGEIQDIVNPDALLCSNTSTLPITELAEGVNRPDDFVGLHFFSPVDKMPLVEIIRGAKTTDKAVAQALDVVQQIRKTPIVVNDSRGFYTSRVIGTMVNEGLAMLAEGVHPMSVERAATQAGYPVGTLQLSDELNMELMAKISKAAADAAGPGYEPHAAVAVIDTMITEGRPGRLRGAGFYDYDENGRRAALWPGLKELFPPQDQPADIEDLKDRYLFIEAIETAKCFEEGVIESSAAANIGSIMGIGYPALTGGTVQFMQGYDGPTGRGLPGFVARAQQLAEKYGDRFAPTERLKEMAEKDESFPA